MLSIRYYKDTDKTNWDDYVKYHPSGTLYHLTSWKKVIEKTYGLNCYYLIAEIHRSPRNIPGNPIAGILPMVHMKHFLFGNSLISIPFFDMAGILANNEEAEQALLSEAIQLGRKLNADTIELRHTTPLRWLSDLAESDSRTVAHGPINTQLSTISCATKSHKVRMLLDLPDSSEALMKNFKAKLRSQIKKPIKEGLTGIIGGIKLLGDFYKVFAVNMRDLGSPVHSKNLIRSALEAFPGKAQLVVIYKSANPIACSLITGFNQTLQNPWASALRDYSLLSPNMLLYWTMLEYACDNGFKYFDFGRSTPEEGTYKFKEQWGAKPVPLHWYFVSLSGQPTAQDTTDKSKFDKAIHYWQKLPVQLTKIIGPIIRKNIGL